MFYDSEKQYDNILGGTWAPYPLVGSGYVVNTSNDASKPARIFCGPGFNGLAWRQDELFAKKYAVAPSTASTPDQQTLI